MERIQTVSRNLLVLFNILLLVLPAFVLAQALFMDAEWMRFFQTPIQTPEGSIDLGAVHWTLLSKTVWFAGLCISNLPIFLSLFVLKALFKNYMIGEIFCASNALHYRKLGMLFFVYGILVQPLSGLLQVLAVTLTNPPGHRYISVAFGTPNLEALFCGTLLIVVSWIMLEASKLREEQALTV